MRRRCGARWSGPDRVGIGLGCGARWSGPDRVRDRDRDRDRVERVRARARARVRRTLEWLPMPSGIVLR